MALKDPCRSDCWLRTYYWRPEPLPAPENQFSVADLVRKNAHAYSPIRTWQIRLLRIHPGPESAALQTDLSIANLVHDGAGLESSGQIVPYIAISYSWGVYVNSESLRCGKHKFHVAPAVKQAIMHLRNAYRPVYLWIDFLCINQNDEAEKALQVRKMSLIYSMATRVVIWLGSMEECGGRSVELLDERQRWREYRIYYKHDDACMRGLKSVLAGLNQLATRPWFKRTWVRQEVFAARELFMRAGHVECSWIAFRYYIEDAYSHLWQETQATDYMKKPARELFSSLDVFERAGPRRIISLVLPSMKHGLQNDEDWMLERYLRGSDRFLATDHRDFVYGILSISSTAVSVSDNPLEIVTSPHVTLPLDYSRTVEQVFSDAALYLVNRHRSLDVILLSAIYQSSASDHPLSLPTWTPDWRKIPVITFLDLIWLLYYEMSSFLRDFRRKRALQSSHGPRKRSASALFGAEWCSSLMYRAKANFYLNTRQELPHSKPHLKCSGIVIGRVGEVCADAKHWTRLFSSGGGKRAEQEAIVQKTSSLIEQLVQHAHLRCVFLHRRRPELSFSSLRQKPPGGRRSVPSRSVCWVPPQSVTGDLIVFLHGCTLPVVLRHAKAPGDDQKFYLLIGMVFAPEFIKAEAEELDRIVQSHFVYTRGWWEENHVNVEFVLV